MANKNLTRFQGSVQRDIVKHEQSQLDRKTNAIPYSISMNMMDRSLSPPVGTINLVVQGLDFLEYLEHAQAGGEGVHEQGHKHDLE